MAVGRGKKPAAFPEKRCRLLEKVLPLFRKTAAAKSGRFFSFAGQGQGRGVSEPCPEGRRGAPKWQKRLCGILFVWENGKMQ